MSAWGGMDANQNLRAQFSIMSVDEPSCSTPRQRPYNLPSAASIEELRTPAFEDLLKSFWDLKQFKHSYGDIRQIVDSSLHPTTSTER
ncbi:hypothetical protein Leryth_002881, partial [Lithospermum erythrorhizon]